MAATFEWVWMRVFFSLYHCFGCGIFETENDARQRGICEEGEKMEQQKPIETIKPRNYRTGWDDAFLLMSENGDDDLLDVDVVEVLDEEWVWEISFLNTDL